LADTKDSSQNVRKRKVAEPGKPQAQEEKLQRLTRVVRLNSVSRTVAQSKAAASIHEHELEMLG
jgi:hypothetical protein